MEADLFRMIVNMYELLHINGMRSTPHKEIGECGPGKIPRGVAVITGSVPNSWVVVLRHEC